MTGSRKRMLLSALVLGLLLCISAFPVAASEATNGAQITVQIPTWNNDTAYVCQLGEGILYIEVESGGSIWPLDTSNPFAATVVTVMDAQGNELGTLESTEGVIDYYDYPDAAKLICSTAFTKDIYEVDLSQFEGTGISQPEYIPEGLGEGRGPSVLDKTLNIAKIITYAAMVIWVVIWIVVIVWLIRNKKARNADPVSGVWKLKITAPNGINECTLNISRTKDEISGILNDALNHNVPLREGKVTPEGWEGLINVDIGMNAAPEFRIEATCINDHQIEGTMTLTAMTGIRSTFTGEKEA